MDFYTRFWKRLCYLWQNIGLWNPIVYSHIRQEQHRFLDAQGCHDYDSLIVFFIPGFDTVTGGIMSIISIARETQKLFSQSKTGVFVCTIPYHPPLAKFTKFENDQTLVNYRDLLSKFSNAKTMLIHVPEHYTRYIANKVPKLLKIFNGNLSFNIMLQNIKLAPDPVCVDKLKLFGPVTITTAHKAYSGKETERMYVCPVHHLSAWVNQGEYIYKTFTEKRNLIIVSPTYDEHPLRNTILNKIQNQLPEFEFIIIENMAYSYYLQIISEAKFSLTFGEGLDGYFLEPIFSGGIGSAVYNDQFFDLEYKKLRFIYASWEDVGNHFAEDVLKVNMNPDQYNSVHRSQLDVLVSNYSYKNYQANIASYYDEYFIKAASQKDRN
jgi:hypothetical protein